MELVVLGIACLAVFTNFVINQHASNFSSSDESVLFSFVKDNSSKNNPVLAAQDTSMILTHSDQFISTALAQSPFDATVALNKPLNKSSVVTASTIQDDVIVKTNPADTQNIGRHGLTTYSVQAGDTIESVASSFGISPQTIMKENKMDDATVLKSGQELTILPTTGITYTLKDGDTLESILGKYKIAEEDFLDANNIESFDDLAPGSTVIIPLDNVTVPSAPKPASKFTNSDTGRVVLKQAVAPADIDEGPISFIWPTYVNNGQPGPANITPGELHPLASITQGFSSRHTGLDISDSKMEPIYAAADGFVEISGYQTNGYGNTIVINHGSGFKTRYGHASELYVSAGDYVKKGQLIAKQGHTGRVRGATGIHLHFEIIKDGKRVNPLAYVQP